MSGTITFALENLQTLRMLGNTGRALRKAFHRKVRNEQPLRTLRAWFVVKIVRG